MAIFECIRNLLYIRIAYGISVANVCMYVCLGQYMPWAGSQQASLNKLFGLLYCVIFCVVETKSKQIINVQSQQASSFSA